MFVKQLLKAALLIFVLIPFLFSRCHCAEVEKRISMAVLPCYDVFDMFKKFKPLAQYVKKRTGLDVDVMVPKNLESLRASLQNGDVDFILQDPHTYAELAPLLNRDCILSALAQDGSGWQRGLIIVRKDSGIKDVGELGGKRVMFGPKLSIIKWVGARELFEENGINIYRDLKSHSHGGCCEDIAFYVFLKAVDAGVVCDDFFLEHNEKKSELGIDLDQIAVIGRTRRFPTRVFAARRGVDAKVQALVNQALLHLDNRNSEDAKVLGPTGIGGFRVSKDKDYESMRPLIGESCP
jgi:phosphonate transport system substrate-binding protein